jgi:nitrogen-specific signal transduction histidine kinase
MLAMEAVTLEARRVLVAVWDSGLGIEPSNHLFTQFFSIRDGGMGMGLSIFHSSASRREDAYGHRPMIDWASPSNSRCRSGRRMLRELGLRHRR